MTGSGYHKANGTITTLVLDKNTIGDVGAVALADALKATFAMCFQCAQDMFLWPSLAQSPDYNHLSTLEHTRSNLIGREVDVLLCAHRVRCGVRCALAKMRIQVSFMDVVRAICW